MSTPATPLDSERADLLAALATARAALTKAVSGLGDEQAAASPTVSSLCPGGLVKHVASTEAGWMRFVVEGPSGMRHDLPDGVTWADLAAGTAHRIPQWMTDHGNEFRMLPGETLDAVLRHYEEVAARTEEVVAGAPTCPRSTRCRTHPGTNREPCAACAGCWRTSSPRPRSTPVTRTS